MLRASRRARVWGQVPPEGDPAVVVPPSTPETPAPVEPATPETPVTPSPATTSDPQVFDLAYVQGLRTEAAGYRVKNKELQDKLDAIALAEMTELERVKTLHQKAETETIPGLQAQLRTLQVENAAVKMGIVDPEVAAKFIDWTKVDGGSTVEAELVALLEAKPYLKGTAPAPTVAPTTPAPTAPVSQSNPAVPSAHQGKKTYTKSQLDAMSIEQTQAEMDDIMYALKNGLVDRTR
jgi:hypothetical protein